MNANVETVKNTMLSVVTDPATPDPVRQWLTTLVEQLTDADQPDPRFVSGGPLPSNVGSMADEYMVVRDERLRIEKVAAEVKKRETEIYNVILGTLDESTDTGAAGKAYFVQRIEKDVNNVKDWPTFWAFIRETNSFDLLGKSLNAKATRERIEAGEELPGVAQEKVATLSFKKVGS